MSRLLCTPSELEKTLRHYTPRFVPALPGRTNHRHSAVVIPLCWDGGVHAVATLRPQHLGNHGGEVCFPGGKPEPTDDSLEATGLRELWEELEMRPKAVLGQLSSIPLYTSDFRITPFVICVQDRQLTINPNEVERAIWFSIEAIFQQECIDAFDITVGDVTKLSPIFIVDGAIMFGATAYALIELLNLIGSLAGLDVPEMANTGYVWNQERGRPVLVP